MLPPQDPPGVAIAIGIGVAAALFLLLLVPVLSLLLLPPPPPSEHTFTLLPKLFTDPEFGGSCVKRLILFSARAFMPDQTLVKPGFEAEASVQPGDAVSIQPGDLNAGKLAIDLKAALDLELVAFFLAFAMMAEKVETAARGMGGIGGKLCCFSRISPGVMVSPV